MRTHRIRVRESREAASIFYQCLLKPRATSRLVLLPSNTHTHTHTQTHTHTHTQASVLSLYFFSWGGRGIEIEAASTFVFVGLQLCSWLEEKQKSSGQFLLFNFWFQLVASVRWLEHQCSPRALAVTLWMGQSLCCWHSEEPEVMM